MTKILLISRSSHAQIAAKIREHGHDPTEVLSFKEGLKAAENLPYNSLIIAEYANTDGDVTEFLNKLEAKGINKNVIVHYAHYHSHEVIKAYKHRLCVHVIASQTLDTEIIQAIDDFRPGARGNVILPGYLLQQKGEAVDAMLAQVRKIGPLEINVALLGCEGQGKDRVARMIHEHSHRSAKGLTFIRHDQYMNYECKNGCGECYLENYFKETEGGTVVLLDIPNYCKRGQSCLHTNIDNPQSNVRVIVTGTREEMNRVVNSGEFNRNLWMKLSQVKIDIPKVDNCPENIEWLIHLIVKELRKTQNSPKLFITDDAVMLLKALVWAGDVMELYNELSNRASICTDDKMDYTQFLDLVKKEPKITGESKENRLRRILKTSPNTEVAWRRYGGCRTTLFNHMRECNLDANGDKIAV